MKRLKNIFVILISSLFLTSCSNTIYVSNKEFVVKQIDGTKSKKECDYVLFDKNNKVFVLKDYPNKYKIGDVIILIRKQ
jgi:PBP1b-binding outer membrane lipoprotein LpoB